MGTRGIIATNSVFFSGQGFSGQFGFDPSQLRAMLLYWDVIEHPAIYVHDFPGHETDAYSVGSFTTETQELLKYYWPQNKKLLKKNSDLLNYPGFPKRFLKDPNPKWYYDWNSWDQLGLLIAEGLMISSKVDIFYEEVKDFLPGRNKNTLDRYLRDKFDLAELAEDKLLSSHTLNRKEKWSISKPIIEKSSKRILGANSRADSVLEFVIRDLLIVPSWEVRLEEILKFKQTRRDGLLRFRLGLDALYTQVLESPNSVDGWTKAAEELELSLLDISRLMSESGMQKLASSLKTYLNISDSSTLNIVLGALGAQYLNAPIELGAAAGLGVNITLNLLRKKTPKLFSLPDNLLDYAYLHEVGQLSRKAGSQLTA